MTRAELAAQHAKRPIRHARHRGDEETVRQLEGTEAHGGVGSGLLKNEAPV
jgi:hypothetical protein